MASQHDDEGTLHECGWCMGSGLGTADGIPCMQCNGKGEIDDRQKDFWVEPDWRGNESKNQG